MGISRPHFTVKETHPRVDWGKGTGAAQASWIPEQMLAQHTAQFPVEMDGREAAGFLLACAVQPQYLTHLVKSLSYWRYF